MIEALYIHVPFCHTICPYCAFAVHGDRPALHPSYLEALEREAALRAHALGATLGPIRSVYIGGGTPSTLSLAEVERLLELLRTAFDLTPEPELAFELNPEDATPDYLTGLTASGINRASLGLQSLHGDTLQALGRNHGPEAGLAAWEALCAHGPQNYNLDLIFGAPRMDGAAFRQDVETLVANPPPHLSLYGLDVEAGTLFHRRAAVRSWCEKHREAQAEAYQWAVGRLQAAGYRHYEVSNFCQPGREGRQNMIVWEGGEYLGLGPGAASYAGGWRWSNLRHFRAWRETLAAGEEPVAQLERLSSAQQADEALMLALRRDTGLDISTWCGRFGIEWAGRRADLCDRLVSEGQARLDTGRLILTPAGFLLADEITAALASDTLQGA